MGSFHGYTSWDQAYEGELAKAVAALRAAGRKPYYFCIEGADEDGAPTHWCAQDADSGALLSPLLPLVDGVAETTAWEKENPGYFEMLTLMDEIQDRVTEEWVAAHPPQA